VLGNWKMNFTQREAIDMIKPFLNLYQKKEDLTVGFAPSFLSIQTVAELLKDIDILIGAQDVFWGEKGAFTGQVSSIMLRDLGVQFCIVGHSETRGRFGKIDVPESTLSYFSETDDTVNLKIRALLFQGIIPVLCVGETLFEREAGHRDSVIQTQIATALEGFDPAELSTLMIAYEPVWAIGTGKVCDFKEASQVCGMIRSTITRHKHPNVSDAISILYGGSIKASNCKDLFSQPDVDGGLVGGASLDAAEFHAIIQNAS